MGLVVFGVSGVVDTRVWRLGLRARNLEPEDLSLVVLGESSGLMKLVSLPCQVVGFVSASGGS